MSGNGNDRGLWKRGLNLEEKQIQRKKEHAQSQNRRRKQEVSKRRDIDFENREEITPQDKIPDIERSVVNYLISSTWKCKQTDLQVTFTRHLATYLSKRTALLIDDVIQQGLIGRFLWFLETDHEELQCETVKILVKIASGTEAHRRELLQSGAVHKIYQLLTSESVLIKAHAIHALGILIGSSAAIRQYVLDQGIVTALLKLEDGAETILVRSYIAHCCAQICKDAVPEGCPILSLAKNLLRHQETDILEDTCWALVYLTGTGSDNPGAAQTVLEEQDIFDRLSELIRHESEHISYTSFVVLCECMKIHNAHTLKSLGKLLPDVLHVLESSTKAVCAVACKTIANITAGHEEYIQAVMDAYVFPTLIGILDRKDILNTPLLTQATKAICNATVKGTAEHIQVLVQMGCVQSLCGLLMVEGTELQPLVLRALRNIVTMETTNHRQHSTELVKKYERDMIKKLPNHEHQELQEMVASILNSTQISEEGEILEQTEVP